MSISASWLADIVQKIVAIEGRAGSNQNSNKRNADTEVERACLSQRDLVISTDSGNDFSYYPSYDGALTALRNARSCAPTELDGGHVAAYLRSPAPE